MASGNRDVELVIRAKNEASKALDAVSSALDTLTKAQSGVSKGASTTGDLLSQLGMELGKLQQKVSGASTLDRLTSSMERAAGSVSRLEKSMASLTDEQAQLAAEVKASEAALGSMTAKALNLQQTLNQQSAVTAKAKSELAALNAEIRAGESSLTKNAQNSSKYEKQLTSLESKLAATKIRHRELTVEILNAESPSKKLIQAFERTDAALNTQVAALSKARAAYAATASSTKEIEASLSRLRNAQSAAAASFEKASASQEATAASLRDTGKAAQEAQKNLGSLRATASDNAAAMERQDAALTKARQELLAVQGAADQANISLERIAATVRQGLLRSLVDSQAQLLRYREQWLQATAAIQAAVTGGAKVSNPTPELSASIAVAQQSKTAYLELQAAIQQMRSSLRDAGSDVTKLTGAQQTFSAALDRVKAKSLEVAAAQQQAAAAANSAGQSAVNAATRQAGAYQSVANSVNRLGAEARNAGSGLDDFASKGRQALSWGERLRAEMIALTTAFVGVFAAIQQLSNVTQTFQDMEAVTSRLSVAFSGNSAVVGREFRYIQAEADRLGIDIRILAGEYSKLAIATRGSSLEGAQTRKIFISLAEAFRVNKLSAEQMQGAFNAITQMVSKGNISMEELRQQLGERLYGAFTLAGKAMGLTGEELSKLIATGKLATDEFLPKFADELNKTFSPELPASLQSLSADIGRFGNEVTKVQMLVANGGFVEGLRAGLQSLTKFFQSQEGQQFFTNLGAAAGGLIKVLAQIPNYIDEISTVFAVLIGRKVAGWLIGIAAGFRTTLATMTQVPAAASQAAAGVSRVNAAVGWYNTSAAAAVPLTTRLQASFLALGNGARSAVTGITAARAATVAWSGSVGVLRGGLALLGGIPGLLITGLTVAFGYWLTSTKDVNAATDEHKRQMQALLDVYSQAKDRAAGWASEVKGVSLAGAEKTLGDLRDQLKSQLVPLAQEISGRLGGTISLGKGLFGETGKQIADLTEGMVKGRISVTAYAKALDDIYKSNADEKIKQVIRSASDLLKQTVESEQALAKQGVVVEQLGGNVSDLKPLIDQLGLSMQKLSEDAGLAGTEMEDKLATPAEKLAKLLDQLKQKVPSLTDDLKLMENLKEIDQILKTADAIKGLDKTSEAYKRLIETAKQAKQELQNAFDEKQFKDSFNILAQGGTAVEQSAALLRQMESFKSTAYFDVNAYRAGFGSDTVTLSDGTIQKITQGMQVSVADANRDLVRRIGDFQNVIRGQIGSERFNSFNPGQQAVLTSVAYNYGSLPARILDAVKTGTSEEISAAIRGLASDNNGVNANRRNQEAYLFQASGQANTEATKKMVDEEIKASEKRAEQEKQYHDRLADSLAVKQQEAELGKKRTLEEEVNLALAKAQNDAKKAGTTLTEKEKQQITETTTVLYQRKAIEDLIAEDKKKQEEGEQRINTLTQYRRDLIEQMQLAQQSGNTEGFSKLEEQLKSVEGQLNSAIDAMIKFWQASADPEKAAAAIANLETLRAGLGKTGQTAVLTGFNVGKAFGDNLISAANNFLAKIRETGDVIGSAKEAFRQFASDFLLQIAQMILKQALLNALTAAFGGSGGGGSFVSGIVSAFGGGVKAGVNHTGGVAGDAGNATRTVSPAWFLNAMRYHTGGVAGLKPNEVPTILQKGEEVLTANDPRHVNNGGVGGAANVKIVNAIDSGSFVSEGMSTSVGQKAVLNFIKANQGAVRGALGV